MGVRDLGASLRRLPPQRRLTLIGWGIGLSWVVVSLPVLVRVVSWESMEHYAVGAEGVLPAQLLVYSAILTQFPHLATSLLWLAVLVSAARVSMTPTGFFRVYSLGVIGGGLVSLLLARALGSRAYLLGPWVALAFLAGALTALAPAERFYLFGEAFHRRWGASLRAPALYLYLFVAAVLLTYWLGFVPLSSEANSFWSPALWVINLLPIAFLGGRRVMVVAVWLEVIAMRPALLSYLLLQPWWTSNGSLTEATCLLGGVALGLVMRRWRIGTAPPNQGP
jgi:hypothetical protein